MDDEELAAMTTKCMDWRKDDSFDVKGLFQPIKPSRDFPKAFQTYRDVLCNGKCLIDSIGVSSIYRSGHQGHVGTGILFTKPVQKPPTTYVPLVDPSENFIPTPESIVEFGVPLIPLPDLFIPAADDNIAAYVDADGDYLYAPMTPPAANTKENIII